MAAFAGIDLKQWRESQKMSAAELAERISCDATTIYRYESGKLKPNPDVMYEICQALGDVSKWYDWMRTEYPMSYGRVHPEQPRVDFKGAVMQLYGLIAQIKSIEAEVLRDGADGRLDDKALLQRFSTAVTELLQNTQRVSNILSFDNESNENQTQK